MLWRAPRFSPRPLRFTLIQPQRLVSSFSPTYPTSLTFDLDSSPHRMEVPLPEVTENDVPKVSTQIVNIDPSGGEDAEYALPVKLIQAGEVVAFPTETVYGLGANALSATASAKIFATKRRPMDNPLIVHVSDEEMLSRVAAHVSETARKLIDKFWPGPLTILFPKSPAVPLEVTCGQPSVAVRMPSHPIARRLISLSNCPIAAPSANLSGRPSPTSAEHVLQDLNERCPCIIDGGSANVGVESTVVDATRNIILRPGGVSLEELREVVPDIRVYSAEEGAAMTSKPPTPGLKAEVIVVQSDSEEKMKDYIISLSKSSSKKLGVIHTHTFTFPKDFTEACVIHDYGAKVDDVASGLFRSLRELDDAGVGLIVMEGVSEEGRGLAVMNRITKAASKTIVL